MKLKNGKDTIDFYCEDCGRVFEIDVNVNPYFKHNCDRSSISEDEEYDT